MSRVAKIISRDHYKPRVDALVAEGFHVRWLTEFQVRINGRFDLYTSSGRWHDVKMNERGQEDDLVAWVRSVRHKPIGARVIDEPSTRDSNDCLPDGAAYWNDVKNGRWGGSGGQGWMHAKGVDCGHRHPNETPWRDGVTCPACLRKLKTDGIELPERPAKVPKVKKPKEERHVFRLYDLRSGTWASEHRHMGSGEGALQERIRRVRGCDPRVEDVARAALLVTREDDAAYIARRQAAFDLKYPHLARKRTE